MLGKLFNLGGGAAPGASLVSPASSTKPVTSLESVQEDVHTRHLLFPDAHALYQHQNDQVFPLSSSSILPSTSNANAFDCDDDIELEKRDIRVLVMQDGLSTFPSALLYDSQGPPPTPSSPLDRPSTAGLSHFGVHDSRRVPVSPRKSSLSHHARPLVIQPESPQLRQGAFDRRPSVHGRAQPRVESEPQRAYREYAEEMAVFSSCIFGNSELLAYKGTSTKVHIVPSETRTDFPGNLTTDGRGSLGRSSARSSKLSQSFSTETVSPFTPQTPASATTRVSDRKKALITRLFPVGLPNDEHALYPGATPQGRFSEDSSGYPFPHADDDSKVKKRKPQPKQKRTPMYAVALIINLPQATSQFPNAIPTSKSSFRQPGSFTEQDSFPSSFGSARRSGWTMVGPGLNIDPLDAAYGNDIEERIDPITQHWDIIMRTLTHLQSVVATTVFRMLKQADNTSPDPFSTSVSSHVSRTPSLSGRRSEDGAAMKPPKTNAKLVTLLPNCLMENGRIRNEVENSRMRLVTGLRASRVVAGQNRWGIWREEARWVARWAGGREQGYFFFNLLTGFLATHTDWLQALSPAWYRERHDLQKRLKGDEDMSLPGRTIIVAHDKMAARRLIFLLAAFLPASQQIANSRIHRPSTSTSWGPRSQSPPSFVVPILKEESLRRKLNRRGGLRRASHSRNTSLHGQNTRSSGVPPHLAHLSMERGHERRSSDTGSIKTANLPILGSELSARKSSAATTTTMTPETTIPHFATTQRLDFPLSGRPGSAGSMAADDLKRTLQRGESDGRYSTASTDSRQSSRWGSVISGLWNPRRRDSTNLTAHTWDSTGSRDSASISPVRHRKSDPLAKMVREAQLLESTTQEQPVDMASAIEGVDPQTPRLLTVSPDLQTEGLGAVTIQRTPNPAGAFESPVKTSINVEDGVIDVEVPFPDYLTSFDTAVSSPSSSGYLSTPGFATGLENFEQSCRISVDGDLPVNVAGWLQRYHPDFVLQAIPPHADLLEQVKASLSAEPSPSLNSHSMSVEEQPERWLDISNVVIADTTNFSISRIRYRRLVKPKISGDRGTGFSAGSMNTYSSALLTPAITPYETQLEEEFIEEPIVALDDVLIEAVERVIAHSSDVSKGSSNCSSRSASIRRGRSNSASTGSEDHPAGRLPLPSQEVPRAECKTVVLTALEEIVREVMNQKEKESQDKGHQQREEESALRGAVRAWLASVEFGA